MVAQVYEKECLLMTGAISSHATREREENLKFKRDEEFRTCFDTEKMWHRCGSGLLIPVSERVAM